MLTYIKPTKLKRYLSQQTVQRHWVQSIVNLPQFFTNVHQLKD